MVRPFVYLSAGTHITVQNYLKQEFSNYVLVREARFAGTQKPDTGCEIK